MAILTFKGGIHPYSGKENTKDKPIEDFDPAGEYVFPVIQHYGSPCVPVVEPGDKVVMGSLIAQAMGFYSSNIFSSVSGTVKAVEPRKTASGEEVESVVIESDGRSTLAKPWLTKPLDELKPDEIRFMIQWAGIVGLGGRTIPTHAKLDPMHPEKIEYVIVNGSECEPFVTSAHREMVEEAERIVQGLRIILKLFPHAKGIIAIEDDKPEAIIRMKEEIKKESDIKVVTVYSKYPQGSQRQLVYACTKRRINSYMVPSSVGCIVINAQTVYNICQAVLFGYPMMHRVITVSGDNIREPKNLRVPLGADMQSIVNFCGGLITEGGRKVVGGPMTGTKVSDFNIPVTKEPSDIICFQKDVFEDSYQTNCIKCGRCIEVCPGRLMPSRLFTFAEKGNMESFKKFDGEECIECGSCSYICPAKIDLAKPIIKMRRQALSERTSWE